MRLASADEPGGLPALRLGRRETSTPPPTSIVGWGPLRVGLDHEPTVMPPPGSGGIKARISPTCGIEVSQP